jgi:hypothetical protein
MQSAVRRMPTSERVRAGAVGASGREGEGAVREGVYQAVCYQAVQGAGSLGGVWPDQVEVVLLDRLRRVPQQAQEAAAALAVGAFVALARWPGRGWRAAVCQPFAVGRHRAGGALGAGGGAG